MPEAIGIALLAAVETAGVAGAAAAGSTVIVAGVTVASAIGSAALIGGAIGLQMLTAKSAADNLATAGLSDGTAAPAENGHVPIRQAIAPRVRGFGRARLAGTYMLYEASGANSYDVLAFHHGRISGIVGYYLNDDVVEIDGSGFVQEQGDGRYAANNIKIETRLGLDIETAYADIVAALPAIWTFSHRGSGLASAALICLGVADPSTHTQIYPRGLPQPSIVADLAPIFDARDESQTYENALSWLVSTNPVLQLEEFLTDADSGMGLERDALIVPVIDALNAEADICDEIVALASGGTELRYASNGFFSVDTDPVNVIAGILDTCDGWISEDGAGGLVCRVGKYRPATFTIASRHIRGFALQKGVASEEAVNEINITYTEPLADYKSLPGDPWRDEDDISIRGQTLSQTFDLPWVQSHTQARRLAKRKMAIINAPLRGTIKTTLWGLQALGERWIVIDAPDIIDDFDALVIEVRSLKIDLLNAQVSIDFVKVDPDTIDAWDPLTEEGVTPTIPDKLVSPPAATPTSPSAFLIAPVHGLPGPLAILVTVDDPGRSDLTYQIQYRISGSGLSFTLSARQAGALSGGGALSVTFATPIPQTPANDYEVQVRAFAPSGAPSAWSTSTTANHL